jgi:hypothetical protein
MTDRSGFTDQQRRGRIDLWRRAWGAVLTEARMVAAWLRTSAAMALDSLLRFLLRPAFIQPPGQFPGLASIGEELGTIAHPRESEVRPPEPFPIRAVRPGSSPGPAKRSPKIFHAARHAGNEP